MRECTERYLELAKQAGTPFTIEIVKSIAALCNEDPYKLWYGIAASFLQPRELMEKVEKVTAQTALQRTDNCWRCPACNKTFNDVRHLVNHITYFVRLKEKAHTELYQKLKKLSDEHRKSFTDIAIGTLKC
ncbi:MAG: hypothetical protein N3E36_06975 [Sulfolobales archaeon]|nr:hypothetical protein [Ignisphaera sp.]MCX8199737.1 hypothetical protein [Sulfolobales archaeon]MDW8086107.1 hypothetical protein [Ignisphaera sp.]